jgi:hypothetical protein
MLSIRRISLIAALLGVAAVRPQELVLAKSNLCTICPVAGVNSQKTTSLGPARTGGPCATRPASNGYPLPDPACTPGAYNPTVTETVFGNKQFTTKCVRDCITDSTTKKTTYSAYHATQNPSCELDHLVPLEMGGADSLDNIWPQCGNVPNGKNYKDIKDQVESYLAIKVIQGMDLDKARNGIASDWTQYIKAAQAFCTANGCDIQKYRK